jgi:hypothetical protein
MIPALVTRPSLLFQSQSSEWGTSTGPSVISIFGIVFTDNG